MKKGSERLSHYLGSLRHEPSFVVGELSANGHQTAVGCQEQVIRVYVLQRLSYTAGDIRHRLWG